jgi:hypothetical protein
MDFAGVEAEFGRLKAQFERGALNEADFKAKLEELMIEDEQGRWWILGYETGQWYVHDGEKWVQQEPPRAAPGPSAARPQYPGATEVMPDAQPRPAATAPSRPVLGRKLGRDNVSVLVITAGWLVFWGAAGFLNVPPYPDNWFVLAIAGGIGGLITGLVLRRMDPPSPWRKVLVVTAGWAVGWAIVMIATLSKAYAVYWLINYGTISSNSYAVIALGIPGALGGLVGGFITSLALKWAQPSIHWKHVAIMTLGWGLGWAAGGALAGEIRFSYNWEVRLAIGYALWGAIGGAVGGWVTFWQLREARRNAS